MRCLENSPCCLLVCINFNPKTSNPLALKKIVLSYVFQAISVDSKGGVPIVTAWQRADCVGRMSSESQALKDSLSTVTFVWYVILLPVLQRSGIR